MVWFIGDYAFRPVRLNFTSAGLGFRDSREMLLDGEVFANAVGLTDWSARDGFQVMVCTSCGHEHCEPGGWLMLRQLTGLYVFFPVFDDWKDQPDEYAPPKLVRRRGVPVLHQVLYQRLCADIPELPEEPASLEARHLADIIRFESRMYLALSPDLPTTRKRVLTALDDDLEASLDRLDEFLRSLSAPDARVYARARTAGDSPITFLLNDAQATEWSPLARTAEDRTALLWHDSVVEVVRGEAAG